MNDDMREAAMDYYKGGARTGG
eukprot:SAG31_NODE_26874_length_435_cov_0.616071_1_plen_21_part_10